MNMTVRDTELDRQTNATGKASAHFLKAMGSAMSAQAATDMHCTDELVFWVSGGYSVNKSTPSIVK